MTEGVGVGLTPRRKPDASVGIYRTPPCFTIASSRRIFVWAIEYHWDSVGVSINNSILRLLCHFRRILTEFRTLETEGDGDYRPPSVLLPKGSSMVRLILAIADFLIWVVFIGKPQHQLLVLLAAVVVVLCLSDDEESN